MSTLRIGLLPKVAGAHFVSHLHILAVAALLPILPGFLGVSFTELGIALSLFNIVSAVVQAPMGFAVDRFGAKRLLVWGLVVGSASFTWLGLFPTYSGLLIAMFFAGIANAVYHPADYALLSQGIEPSRLGRAFSIHTFGGFLGAAAAPMVLPAIAASTNPRLAFFTAALIGFIAVGLMLLPGGEHHSAAPPKPEGRSSTASIAKIFLLSPVVLSLTLLFVLLNLSTSAIEKFSVTALVSAQGVSLTTANSALTAFLVASAFGVLAGGGLADRVRHHGLIAAASFALAACLVVIVAMGALEGPLLIATLGAAGFFTGVIAPSRDMLVRAASPKGAEGKTFGFVSTGFDVGGAVGPIIFGWVLDKGHPSAIFWGSAVFMALTILLTLIQSWYLSRPKSALSTVADS